MVTGSFDDWTPSKKERTEEVNPIVPSMQYALSSNPSRNDKGVTKYFKSLGYDISWDFNRRDREEWYEILLDDKLVAQIDTGVPLADIYMDFCEFAKGKRMGVSKSDYKVCGNGPAFEAMLKKVAANPPKND